jgi:hypothetical protein
MNDIPIELFIATVIIGLCAYYFVYKWYKTNKQLKQCQKELTMLKSQNGLSSNSFTKPHISPSDKTTTKVVPKGVGKDV